MNSYERELILKALKERRDRLQALVDDPNSGETDDEAIEVEHLNELIQKYS